MLSPHLTLSKLKSLAIGLLSQKKQCPPIVKSVMEDGLTYLSTEALVEIYDEILRIEAQRVQGILIEVGCALGGSAIAIAHAKSKARTFKVYDVFGMIPPPSKEDDKDVHERYKEILSGESKGIGGNTYYGYKDNLLEKVTLSFTDYGLPIDDCNVQLVQGLVEDTLYISDDVALAHIDCDWYDPVKTCLERIEPKLIRGGLFVIDDYYAWSGCKKAVDEFFSDKMDRFHFTDRTRLHVVKTRDIS